LIRTSSQPSASSLRMTAALSICVDFRTYGDGLQGL
jgi:hypothetical protein